MSTPTGEKKDLGYLGASTFRDAQSGRRIRCGEQL